MKLHSEAKNLIWCNLWKIAWTLNLELLLSNWISSSTISFLIICILWNRACSIWSSLATLFLYFLLFSYPDILLHFNAFYGLRNINMRVHKTEFSKVESRRWTLCLYECREEILLYKFAGRRARERSSHFQLLLFLFSLLKTWVYMKCYVLTCSYLYSDLLDERNRGGVCWYGNLRTMSTDEWATSKSTQLSTYMGQTAPSVWKCL